MRKAQLKKAQALFLEHVWPQMNSCVHIAGGVEKGNQDIARQWPHFNPNQSSADTHRVSWGGFGPVPAAAIALIYC